MLPAEHPRIYDSWMRGWLAIAGLLGGCGFEGSGTSSDAPIDAEPGRPDASPDAILWRLEAAPDFEAGSLTSGIAFARGGIEPIAWAYGVLRVRGSDDREFTTSAADQWDQLEAIPVANRSGFALTVPPSFDQRRPAGIGLGADDDWTMWGDGEIFLEMGSHDLTLVVDDAGFLDISADGTTFTRLLTDVFNVGGAATGTFQAPATGWYRIRFGMSQGSGGATFHLIDDPPGESATVVQRSRFRAPINDLTGVLQHGFDHGWLIRPVGSDLHDGDLVDVNWAMGVPPDLGITGVDFFSVRWTGQFWIETPDSYVFSVANDDGHRLWIDGAPVLSDWQETQTSTGTSAAIALGRGWHDLVFDQTEGVLDANARLRMATAVGSPAPIPAALLRPATPRGERLSTATRMINANLESFPVLDTALDFDVAAATGAMSREVTGAFTVDHNDWSQVQVLVDPPGATTATSVYDVASDSSPDTQTHDIGQPSGLNGIAVDGRWRMEFRDTNSPNSGTVEMAALTICYAGGEPTVAPDAQWTSAIHDLGRTATIENVMYEAVVPAGVTMTLEVRACAMPDCTDMAPWQVVASSGANPGAAPGRYAQLRVRFEGDGDGAAWLDWIDVNAR